MTLDKVVGVYHFLGDKAPQDIPLVEPKPRKVSAWRRDGQPLVSRVKDGGDARLSIEKAISLLGSPGQAIARGDRVLVKPNFNSPDPPPASTDLTFLHAVIEILREAGAKVVIGECAGGLWRPTQNVFRKLGVHEFASKLGVKLIAFEDSAEDWVRIKVEGEHLKTVTMPRSAYEADRLVYVPCVKTHNLAHFSGAIKLAMGFRHPGERRSMHMGNLQQKIAEISLCWQPDLIVMDGRKAFISGGPDAGELAEPGLVLASGDLIAIDIEAMKIILSYQAKNRLPANPRELPQIVTALKHGLGASDYMLVE